MWSGFFVFLVGILRSHAWDVGPWDRMRLHEAILAELIVRIKCHIRILIQSLTLGGALADGSFILCCHAGHPILILDAPLLAMDQLSQDDLRHLAAVLT